MTREEVRFRNFLRHSTSVSHAVLRSPVLTLQEKGLYSIICSYGWAGKAFPGQKRLAKENGVSERTIRRTIKRLVELRLLTVEDRRKQNKTNIYYIEFPDDEVMKFLFPDGYEDQPPDTDDLRGGDHRTPVSSAHRTPVSYKDISVEESPDKYKDQPPSGRSKNKYPDDFEEFWSIYPRKVGKKRAFSLWKRRTETAPTDLRATPQDLIKAARNYARYCELNGTEQKYIKHPSTFLSDKLDYEDWLQPVEPTKPKYPDNVRQFPRRQSFWEEQKRREEVEAEQMEYQMKVDRFVRETGLSLLEYGHLFQEWVDSGAKISDLQKYKNVGNGV